MSLSTNKCQVQALINIMEGSPDIARGFFKGSREEIARFWGNVEEELNSFGPPTKSAHQWKRVWADQKKYIRQKAAQNLQNQRGTGGDYKLSPIEEAIYNLVGMKMSVEGVPAKTFGLGTEDYLCNALKKTDKANDETATHSSPPCRYVLERQKLKDRPRKILNLEERVQAIRMYDELPVYQRVASAFKCSWEQIKNVVANRHQILKYYASCQIIDLAKDDPKVVRHKKINFLGNCMYEYIKRAQYHEQQDINDDLIRNKAKEFKEIINIEKFFPNSAWIRDFKSVFNIDLEHMSEIIVSGKPQKSLNCKDIITYCAKEVDSALSSQPGNTQNQLLSGNNPNKIDRSDHDEFIHHLGFEYDEGQPEFDEDMINEDEEGPTIDFGSYCDDQDEDLIKKPAEEEEQDIKPDVSILEDILKNPHRNNMLLAESIKEEQVDEHVGSCEVSVKSPSECSSKYKEPLSPSLKRRAGSPITTYGEALAFMKPLEDFAICEEDFKAINLLTQLAEVYQKAKRRKTK